jgi:O-antigen/teichoic acid export membrane protein
MKKGFSFFMMPLWRGLLFQGSIIVTRVVLGPEAAALWGTMRMLSRSVVQGAMVIEYSSAPELQVEIAKGEVEKARNLHQLMVVYALCVGLAGALMLFIFGDFIYGIWTTGELVLPRDAWRWLVVGIIPCCVWSASSAVLRAVNRPEVLARSGLFLSCLVCVSIYLLAPVWGFIVIPISAAALDLILLFIVLRASLEELNDRFGKVLKFLFSCKYLNPKVFREIL